MTQHILCDEEDIWIGEIRHFDVDDTPVLLTRLQNDELKAYLGLCPHQDRQLEETGELRCMCGMHKNQDTVLTCTAHSYEFDLESGEGVNPDHTELRDFPLEINEDGEILISIPEE